MTAAELREALADVQLDRSTVYNTPWEIIEETARSWLRILEGDEQLVEKVARVLYDRDRGSVLPWEAASKNWQETWLIKARAVLAAITEEEQK